MYIVGIDPGLSGGLSVVSFKGKLEAAIPLPKPFCISEELKQIINFYKFSAIKVYVEKPFIKKGTDSKSTYTTIMNYGILLKSIQMFDLDRIDVEAISWKSAFKLSKDKEKSIQLCLQLFPESKPFIYGKNGGKKDGIAEAILIAEYGRQDQNRRLIFK